MNAWLDGVFGLDGVSFSGGEAVLTFARPLPLWAWAMVFGGVVALVSLSYVRLSGAVWGRVVLAGLRVVALMVLLLVAAGPELRKENERTEPDWVVVLVDRSQSMGIADVVADGNRETREEQMRRLIEGSREELSRAFEQKRVVWLGFDGGVYELGRDGELDIEGLGEASGRSTAIGAAIEGALARVAARPVSAIVVLSDGRSVDGLSRNVARALERQRVPVHVVPLGSETALADVGIRRVRAPEVVFALDTVTVEAEIEVRGGGRARALLRDVGTDRVLDEVTVEGSGQIRLSSAMEEAGARRLAVELVTEGMDLVEENNRAEVMVESVDRPLRVLYVDGYPRWEHRYLKSMLLRERSIESSSLLLAANRRYLQEGDVEIVGLPGSVEEWAEYDVVVIGDVRPELIGQETLGDLKQHVSERGAGLIWIGGSGAMPRGWRGSALADVLPMSLDSERSVREFAEPVVMERTEAAEALRLLELSDEAGGGWPSMLSDPRTGWSRLQWAQRIEGDSLKPGAMVLAEFEDGGGERHPAVVMMRFGAGMSVYVATDETWRWRYGRGEDLMERFWVPMIRQLGRASLARGERGAVLSATPEEAVAGQVVRIRLELVDQALIDAKPSGVGVRIGDGESEVRLRLDPDSDGRGRSFAGVWATDRAGRFVVEVDDALVGRGELKRPVVVSWPDDESRNPEADHGFLAEIAGKTGGKVLSSASLEGLGAELPNRAVTVLGEPEIRTLWDRPFVLVLLIGLLGLEWVGRRLMRLA